MSAKRCIACGETITNGYFEQRPNGETVYICGPCLGKYAKRRKGMKYDHKQIYEWHLQGIKTRVIADYLGTNPLTVGMAIREQEKLHEEV